MSVFNLFKPKQDASALGKFCGHIFRNFFEASTPTIATQIDLLVAAGASSDRIVAELAIFAAFQAWVGIAASLQNNRVTDEQFDRIISAYWQELQRQSELMNVESIGSSSYATVFEWMEARLLRYQTVLTTTDPAKANLTVVEHFCDFAFDGEASPDTKQQLQDNYERGSRHILAMIAKVRVV